MEKYFGEKMIEIGIIIRFGLADVLILAKNLDHE